MSEKKEAREALTPSEKIEKVSHDNIFQALAAFQGENPEIKRTKEFGKDSDKLHWWYAPLDENLRTVRPLTARHGLAFTWEKGGNDGEIVCALYHETYKKTIYDKSQTKQITKGVEQGGNISYDFLTISPFIFEENVLRSLPVTVSRKGDMKDIGANSTYARRTTLAEVLGIAPDEDNDIGFDEERGKKLESFAFGKAKEGIQKTKTIDDLFAKADFFHKDLKAIEEKKTPSLGLKKEQYEELLELVGKRQAEIEKSMVGKGRAGENNDAGGQATLTE